jgi:hypothetical protein
MLTTVINTDNAFQSITSIVEKDYSDISNLISSLETNYSIECQEAAANEEQSEIKVIVDRAKEFAENHQFYQLHSAIIHSVFEIKKFRESHETASHAWLVSIHKALIEFINIHKASLKNILASCKKLHDIHTYCEYSKTKDLRTWAEALEKLGDALEDNIEFISVDALERLQPSFFDIVQKSQKKSSKLYTRQCNKEAYRIRIRNASGFICRLIDYSLEKACSEDTEALESISNANHPIFFED